MAKGQPQKKPASRPKPAPPVEMKNFHPIVKPRPVIIVAGIEGTRKTTFGMSFPGPIYIIGTESGHEQDTAYRLKEDKKVFTTRLAREIQPKYDKVWCAAYKGMWKQVMNAARELATLPAGTVIVDSATDLFGMAAADFNREFDRGDTPIPPMMYGQVYPLLGDLLEILRGRHFVVLTSRMKDTYKDGKATGSKTLGLWKDAAHGAEEVIYLEVVKSTNEVFAHGRKGLVDGAIIHEPTFEKLYGPKAKDYWFGDDDNAMYQIQKQLGVAYAALDAKKVQYQKRKCTTVQEYQEYISELRETGWPTTNTTEAAAAVGQNGVAGATQG